MNRLSGRSLTFYLAGLIAINGWWAAALVSPEWSVAAGLATIYTVLEIVIWIANNW